MLLLLTVLPLYFKTASITTSNFIANMLEAAMEASTVSSAETERQRVNDE
jgi:hypothetical protein